MAETRRFSARRELGRTGFRASALGIGDLADGNVPFERSLAILQRALDAGLNLLDTAPNYEDGLSERLVGAALRGVARDSVFVIDKVDHFDRPVAPQIASSLQRLQLESADLFVFHRVSNLAEYELLTQPGGRYTELRRCRDEGKCRFIGLSAHDPAVLERALDDQIAEVLMFPLGPFVDSRYVQRILPRSRELGVGSVCFKTFGAGKLLGDTSGYGAPLATGLADLPHLSVRECLSYTLTWDPDVALLGLSSEAEQDAAFAAAEQFAPLNHPELVDIAERARRAITGKGACWWNPEPH